MKEIGERLKEARESMGISIEEAAEDLKLRPSQLTNIEEGNRDAFKDIFYLKYFIRDYAKYLGLDYEAVVEDFNEFVFDYTSKISIDDIKKASNKSKEPSVKKVASPYTTQKKDKGGITRYIIFGITALVICIIVYCVILFVNKDNDNPSGRDINSKDVAYILK